MNYTFWSDNEEKYAKTGQKKPQTKQNKKNRENHKSF